MRRLAGHRFRRQTLTFWLCVGVVAGLALARFGLSAGQIWLLPAGLTAAVGWRRHSWLTLVSLAIVGLLAGLGRGNLFSNQLSGYQTLAGHEVNLTVQAVDDSYYGSYGQLTFQGSGIMLAGGGQLAGKVQVSGFGVNAVFEGDKVAVSGKVYVSGGGPVQAYINYARLTVLERHPSPVGSLRQKFVAGMQTALPPPLAAFAMGLLVGQRADLPAGVKQDLLMVGLTHIIAVSGYNLTVILHAGRHLLARRSKRISTLLSFGLIAVFLLLTGASASIVRAAIVSTLSIISAYYGRELKPLNLLAIAAAITAWANPFYLWSDLSWYLSFLAFFGVMVIAPLVKARLHSVRLESVIAQVALETVCAEVMSLPIILYSFGQISLIGLPANVLITSLVPLAMLLSLIAGLAGMFAGTLAGWLALPAQLLLNYMLDLAHIMARLPHVFEQNRSLALGQMLALYMAVVVLVSLLYYKTKSPKPDIITDTNVGTQQVVNH